MTSSPSFLHWYDVMLDTGEPMVIPEYGQYVLPAGERPDPDLQRARAEAIRADARWIADHPRVRIWLYWQDTGHQGDWAMTDELSQQAWSAAARTGCRSERDAVLGAAEAVHPVGGTSSASSVTHGHCL